MPWNSRPDRKKNWRECSPFLSRASFFGWSRRCCFISLGTILLFWPASLSSFQLFRRLSLFSDLTRKRNNRFIWYISTANKKECSRRHCLPFLHSRFPAHSFTGYLGNWTRGRMPSSFLPETLSWHSSWSCFTSSVPRFRRKTNKKEPHPNPFTGGIYTCFFH